MQLEVLDLAECVALMDHFATQWPETWNEDIGGWDGRHAHKENQ